MWIVEKDHESDGRVKDVKVMSIDYDESKDSELKYQFRMYDDDKNLYYEGRSDSWDDEEAFGPLDDYGMPNAGCTYIEYKNPTSGEWEVL